MADSCIIGAGREVKCKSDLPGWLQFTWDLETAGFTKYSSKAAAQAAAKSAPLLGKGNVITDPGTTAKNVLSSNLSGALSFLGQSSLWQRVLEVAAGLLLLTVGTNAVLRNTPIQRAAHAATKVIR